MRAIYRFLNRVSTVPALFLSVLLFVSFIVYFLPLQKTDTAVYSRDAGSVGLSFFPAPEKIYRWAEAYGPEGRSAFIKVWLTYDLFWPLAYTALFLVFINISFRYVHGERGARLCGLALLTLLLDYAENALAIIIMVCYPDRLEPTAWVLATANALKWICMGAVSVLFAYGLAALPVCFFYNKYGQRTVDRKNSSSEHKCLIL